MRAKENWISFTTLLNREIVRVLRIWPQTLMPTAITISLYFIIFGDIIGPRIGEMQGVSYIQYIVPGLIMMAIITNAYLNVCSSVFGNKFQRNIEEMLIAPMPNHIIICGYAGAGVIRGIIVGIVVALVSLCFGKLTIHSWLVTFSVAILTSTLFALAGFINGILAKKFDDISIIPMFVLTPLTYLGGVFYSVDLLPRFWQIVSSFNPVLYMVNGFRWGLLGIADVQISIALWILLIAVIICYGICWWMMERGIGIKS